MSGISNETQSALTPVQERRVRDIALWVYLIASGEINREGYPAWVEAKVCDLWKTQSEDEQEFGAG